METSRRSFLRLLRLGAIGSISGIELDIDRLLWVPSFLPPDWVNRTDEIE